MGRPKLVGLLLVCLSVLVTLALLELALRTGAAAGIGVRSRDMVQNRETQKALHRREPALAEPYRDRVFELRANAHQVFRGDEFSIEMAINSRRLRDGEHAVSKPSGVYRVLALGDSFTFGWGVEATETWWAALGTLIGRDLAPTPVEVINLGVYMYTFDQQVQRLEDFGLAYEPDLIVADFYYPHVVTISNHVYEARASKPWPRILDPTMYVDAEGLLRYGRPLPFEGLRRMSVLADFLISRLKLAQYRASAAGRLNEYELIKESRQPEFEDAWDHARAAYGRLAMIARARDIPVVVFMIPRDMQVWPPWKREHAAIAKQAPFTSKLPQQRFAAICERLGMRCLDLLPELAAAAAREPHVPLYYPVDVHWTPAGHALASRFIHEYLVSSRLVRGMRDH